jgi:pimeloyl-ACP methyl ester carboxylesterase
MFDPYTRSTRISSIDVDLTVTEHGPSDGEPVLMLHGFPDSAGLWRNQIPRLADAGYRVIAPDLRGFGHSDRPESVEDYTLRRHAGDVAAIIDHLGVDRAHVVGHDWGAALTWYLGIVQPALFRSATVLSVGHPTVFASAGLEQKRRSWYMLLFQFPDVAERWLSSDDWRWLREWSGFQDEADHWIEQLSRPGALTAALNIYRANMAPETWAGPPPALPPMPCDTMGVWSTGDTVLLESQVVESEAYVTGRWRYERIDDADHWIPLTAPDRLTSLLLDWLG